MSAPMPPSDTDAWQEDRLRQYCCPVATNHRRRSFHCLSNGLRLPLTVLSDVIHGRAEKGGRRDGAEKDGGPLQMFLTSSEAGRKAAYKVRGAPV